MNPEIPYTALQDDLYYPCKNAVFFPYGIPKNDAALCAEMARLPYCRHADDFAFDREKIQTVLGTVGFESCDFVESEGRPMAKGFHGFVARRAASSGRKELAVLSFRGTDKDDLENLLESAEFIMKKCDEPQRGRVHKGFADALEDLLPRLTLVLEGIPCDILFTGHSLGAAMATLMAGIRAPKTLYTFGSPRVGDEDFVDSLKAIESYRFVDCSDMVARVPPSFLGYRHLGKSMYIDSQRRVISEASDEYIDKDREAAESEYREKYAGQPGNVSTRKLADHAPLNYVMPLAAIG